MSDTARGHYQNLYSVADFAQDSRMSTTLITPRTTQAAILTEELAPGQVLVEVKTSGICGAQINEIDGVKGDDHYLPHLLGHEGCATVLAVGPAVTVVTPGDSVVLHWRKGRGIDAKPAVYRWRGKQLNAGWVTTFNHHAVLSENRMTPVAHDLDPAVAALFGCAVTSALGSVTNLAHLRIGESVVVFGVGGVGLNAVQGAALMSAHPVVAVDLVDAKLELAHKVGATHTINARTADARAELAKILGKEGADVIIECTGAAPVIQLAYEASGPRGRVVLVGVPRKGNNISIYSLPLHFGKVLTGSHGGDTDPSADIPRYLRLVAAGKLKLDELITNRFRFGEINQALDMMRRGEIAGRCILSFG